MSYSRHAFSLMLLRHIMNSGCQLDELRLFWLPPAMNHLVLFLCIHMYVIMQLIFFIFDCTWLENKLYTTTTLIRHWRIVVFITLTSKWPRWRLKSPASRLFTQSFIWRRSWKTSKLCVTGFCAGNSSGPVNSPHKRPVTRKMFPFDDVIMFACKHVSVHVYFEPFSWYSPLYCIGINRNNPR